jgi:hypothetical protein
MWHYYAVLVHLFLQNVASQTTASTFPIPNLRIFYCPFSVNYTIAPDASSIDFTYAASESQEGFFSRETAKCYVQLDFVHPYTTNTSAINQVEYTGDLRGDETGELETSTVWFNNYGPVRHNCYVLPVTKCSQTHYTRVKLSSSSLSGAATNTSYANQKNCGDTPGWSTGEINVQTIFHSASSTDGPGLKGSLTQRLKLSWIPQYLGCMFDDQCYMPDSSGLIEHPELCT